MYLHTEPTRLNITTINVSAMLLQVGLMLRGVYFRVLILEWIIGKEAVILAEVATLVGWSAQKCLFLKQVRVDPCGTLSVDDVYNV